MLSLLSFLSYGVLLGVTSWPAPAMAVDMLTFDPASATFDPASVDPPLLRPYNDQACYDRECTQDCDLDQAAKNKFVRGDHSARIRSELAARPCKAQCPQLPHLTKTTYYDTNGEIDSTTCDRMQHVTRFGVQKVCWEPKCASMWFNGYSRFDHGDVSVEERARRIMACPKVDCQQREPTANAKPRRVPTMTQLKRFMRKYVPQYAPNRR
ncbi:MAG: hypothetical protein M1826_004897 [Phylliscum demangeonii]|nr:MAG: hypothetical protein M1826_004897 [Phylliscum demangeonii]